MCYLKALRCNKMVHWQMTQLYTTPCKEPWAKIWWRTISHLFRFSLHELRNVVLCYFIWNLTTSFTSFLNICDEGNLLRVLPHFRTIFQRNIEPVLLVRQLRTHREQQAAGRSISEVLDGFKDFKAGYRNHFSVCSNFFWELMMVVCTDAEAPLRISLIQKKRVKGEQKSMSSEMTLKFCLIWFVCLFCKTPTLCDWWKICGVPFKFLS